MARVKEVPLFLLPPEGIELPARKGLWKCAGCREQFSATVGTVFEDSHVPMSKWLLAIHLLCASKKGMSAHQLHRMIHVSYKTAWFMFRRQRYAMSQHPMIEKMSGVWKWTRHGLDPRREASEVVLAIDAARSAPLWH